MQTDRIINAALLSPEISFITSRSSGPGGQNVNKVNSKVTLRFDLLQSQLLTADEISFLKDKLASKLTTEGVLVLSSQDKRSQLENKEAVMIKLDFLLKKAFTKKKHRKATKPTFGSVQKKIKQKKQLSEKKKWRQKLD